MVSRAVLALLAVALIAVSASAAPVEDLDARLDEEFERIAVPQFVKEAAKKAVQEAIKELVKYVKGKVENVNFECVREIYDTCDINPVLHPKKYYKCAKKYFLEHKEHCYHSQ